MSVNRLGTRGAGRRLLGGIGAFFLGVGWVEASDEFFRTKIKPLLHKRCYECHSHEAKIKGGLALDSKVGWEKGGDTGPALVPGKPDESLLIRAVSHVEKDLQMPPKEKLSGAERELLREWIRMGAPDPRVGAVGQRSVKAEGGWEEEFRKRMDWWSLQPMSKGEPPVVSDGLWAREPVDRFIKAGLEAVKLEPAPAADEETLRRRLSFVLTGLPPVAHGKRATGYEATVDALLGSPHFGERFARHWMDVVRYTDTHGYEWDGPVKGAHEYRDYLVRAFNGDVGFDQMLREQLAGDLLKKPRVDEASGSCESLIGPAFYHLGEHRHGSRMSFGGITNGVHQEMLNNKIDAFSKAFLATTVACARCHDHKLEAVSQRDYYALAAMFTRARWTKRTVDSPEVNKGRIARLKELRGKIREGLAVLWAEPLEVGLLEGWAGEHRELLTGVGTPLGKPLELERLAAEWRQARESAQRKNAGFQRVPMEAWVFEGAGFEEGRIREGTPLVALEGERVVARLLSAGWHSHALSSKLPGSLRTPAQHQIPGKFLSIPAAGGEFGGHLVAEGNAFLNEGGTNLAFYENREFQ
jgi:hypothetical protein